MKNLNEIIENRQLPKRIPAKNYSTFPNNDLNIVPEKILHHKINLRANGGPSKTEFSPESILKEIHFFFFLGKY